MAPPASENPLSCSPANSSLAQDSLQFHRLRTLMEATEVLCASLDLDEVLRRILLFATRELNAERSTLYQVDQATGDLVSLIAQGLEEGMSIRLKPGEGVAGHVARTGEVVTVRNVREDTRFTSRVDQQTGFLTSSMLAIPLVRGQEVRGVLQVLNRREGFFDNADRDYLLALGSLLAVAIENAYLHRQELVRQRLEIEREHLEAELRTARAIQERFLPAEAPQLVGVDVAGANIPSEHVSGDYFDYLPESLHGGTGLGLVVADVSGHGIPAALIMSLVRAGVRAPAGLVLAPGGQLAMLNELLYASTDDTRFATMILGMLDIGQRRLRYASAGHNPPLLLRADGRVERLVTGGIPLGMMPGRVFPEAEVSLGPGDLVIFYTDGVTEAHRGEEEFGEERLVSLMRRNQAKTAREITTALTEEVLAFGGRSHPEDDVTAIVLRML